MRLGFSLDEGMAKRAAIGLIVLQSDETLEPEILPLLQREGVVVYVTRIPSAPDVTPKTLAQMKLDMPRAASLLPGKHPMDVVAYCCTSGATIIGPEVVAEIVRQHHPLATVTNPLSAVIAACRHLGVTRLGMVTPYLPSVSEAMRLKLAESGITIGAFGSFEQEQEATVARIDTASVEGAICSVGAETGIEAVFASCTNLRTLSVIKSCEARLKKPVISSNLALAWHILSNAGLETKTAGPGWLFAQ